MFKFSVRSEVTRKYYERRIKRFFDFIDFSLDSDIEERCNRFAEKAQKEINWAINKIIIFLLCNSGDPIRSGLFELDWNTKKSTYGPRYQKICLQRNQATAQKILEYHPTVVPHSYADAQNSSE